MYKFYVHCPSTHIASYVNFTSTIYSNLKYMHHKNKIFLLIIIHNQYQIWMKNNQTAQDQLDRVPRMDEFKVPTKFWHLWHWSVDTILTF